MNNKLVLALVGAVIVIAGIVAVYSFTKDTTAPNEDPGYGFIEDGEENAEDRMPTETGSETEGMTAEDDAPGVYTMAEVQANNSADSCWVAVGDVVHDVTDWVSKHPGGAQAILGICGTDGTAVFTAQHGSFEQAISTLASYKIGTLEK